jgi:hypothetical protein
MVQASKKNCRRESTKELCTNKSRGHQLGGFRQNMFVNARASVTAGQRTFEAVNQYAPVM